MRELDVNNFAFPSTGNQDEDDRIARRFALHESRMSQNICPNGCGQMIFDSLNERHCQSCGFVGWCSSPIQIANEKVQ